MKLTDKEKQIRNEIRENKKTQKSIYKIFKIPGSIIALLLIIVGFGFSYYSGSPLSIFIVVCIALLIVLLMSVLLFDQGTGGDYEVGITPQEGKTEAISTEDQFGNSRGPHGPCQESSPETLSKKAVQDFTESVVEYDWEPQIKDECLTGRR